MKTPDDDDPSANDEPAVNADMPDGASENSDVPAAPAPTEEEPVVVAFSEADFDAMLGSFNEIALHVVIGGDDDHDDRPRARVGRYERRDP